MAQELQTRWDSGKTVYFQVRSSTGTIWNGSSLVAYATADVNLYKIAATEQGSASGYYTGTMPSVAAGVYNVVAFQQLGGSPAETDTYIGSQTLMWSGTAPSALSDAATSGQVGTYLPQRMARGVQILNFPVYLKSAADHVTPFTSGVVSGQIARDGGAFGPLQSGAFSEQGLGWYNLQALTSGDVNANTVRLQFTAVGISGGASDPLPLGLVLQRVSGQTIT